MALGAKLSSAKCRGSYTDASQYMVAGKGNGPIGPLPGTVGSPGAVKGL